MKNIDFYCIKIQILDVNENILDEKFLSKLELRSCIYEKEGIDKFKSESPCVLQRRIIERDVCLKVAKSINTDKIYKKEEIGFVLENYNVDGDFFRFIF